MRNEKFEPANGCSNDIECSLAQVCRDASIIGDAFSIPNPDISYLRLVLDESICENSNARQARRALAQHIQRLRESE